jgi:protein-L-isoaspartate(D-aspartate) O-methyltransferase
MGTETLHDMVEWDLKDRGVTDERVLAAFRRADRKFFVPRMERHLAYEDRALILSHGQTISQPYMVGVMTQALALTGQEKVLEIGTGSGFQTAILACIAREVFTVERIEYLATTAEDLLLDLGFKNIHYKLGDGSLGWVEHAPYDRVLVTAACPKIPEALISQLRDGGILVAPVGDESGQDLVIATKRGSKLDIQTGTSCQFVKLIGREGFSADGEN